MRDYVLTIVQALDQDFLSTGSSFDFSTSFGSKVWDQVLSLVQALDQDVLSTGSSFHFSTSFGPRLFKYGIKF